MDYPKGVDPYVTRQHLLHHTYSPLISVHASYNADILLQSFLGLDDISTLQILKPYGNNAKYTVPNQSFKIINNQLITKAYPSFPVRFEPSLPELLTVFNATKRSDTNDAVKQAQLDQLFSISSLEMFLNHSSRESSSQDSNKDLYLTYFNKIITSNNIVPFETFNHPIAQLFVVDFDADTIETLRKSIVEFRNYNFPRFFQIDDLLIHVLVMYDATKFLNSEVVAFQNDIKATLNILSTSIPINTNSQDEPTIEVSLIDNSTIEEDLQRISLQQSSASPTNQICIPKSLDSVLRARIYELINKFLIPHMQSKIRVWDDQILQPKKSITGRFFSASKKFFNNSNSELNLIGPSSSNSSSFNYTENYYYKSSPEQTVRKLADWSLILKDFKYAYSTYDVIKKDYTNDKAWVYVASTQEMCIVSLLLAQTQQVSNNPTPPDKNTLRKIRHDIVEPYIDNLSYTFKSRLNLKTYSLKTLAIVTELLLCMCTTFSISWWWTDLIEKYLLKSVGEYDAHLLSSNQDSQVIRAILYERLGYSCGKCLILNGDNQRLLVLKEGKLVNNQVDAPEPEEEGLYVNPKKLLPSINEGTTGLSRYRKSAIWYLLSIKEWLILKNYGQIQHLMNNIRFVYDIDELGEEWYDRGDLLLGFIKRFMKENRASELGEDTSAEIVEVTSKAATEEIRKSIAEDASETTAVDTVEDDLPASQKNPHSS
ncbi:uncharacterized protein CANTADRAFT_91633 [Suhomyces tanzawaensis NRRL Y-17324]|uniref:Uncharacterized protein n=1 Tax=Suhomyces tanzawaensis NRRL Y-17324 TaxID=984487 RepID=A0A1E4SFC2_9ASCO|nr:uncharacterized protein CANTADRAFT_91633 [Suhomyces tanzawaensis NRRL Y-17324]ODV78211.1 hypothetical protein CANTADRAFT_91633 [Suhomyces tanzawaensis NRRL Y-17324]